MSEQPLQQPSPERPSTEAEPSLERALRNSESSIAAHTAERPHDQIEEFKYIAQTEAKSATEVSARYENPLDTSPAHIYSQHKELKTLAYQSELQHIQSQLSPVSRQFSKLIHLKSVETVSAVASASLGRPIGLLFAGIFSLAGSCFVLLLSYKYGFRYNFGIFIALLTSGYITGLTIELLTGRRKSRY